MDLPRGRVRLVSCGRDAGLERVSGRRLCFDGRASNSRGLPIRPSRRLKKSLASGLAL
jgi:hypothetical protein